MESMFTSTVAEYRIFTAGVKRRSSADTPAMDLKLSKQMIGDSGELLLKRVIQ